MRKYIILLIFCAIAPVVNGQVTYNARVGSGFISYAERWYYSGDYEGITYCDFAVGLAVESNIPLKKYSRFVFSPSIMFLYSTYSGNINLVFPCHFGYKCRMGRALFIPKIGLAIGYERGYGYSDEYLGEFNDDPYGCLILGPSIQLPIETRHFIFSVNYYHGLTRSGFGAISQYGFTYSFGYKF